MQRIGYAYYAIIQVPVDNLCPVFQNNNIAIFIMHTIYTWYRPNSSDSP